MPIADPDRRLRDGEDLRRRAQAARERARALVADSQRLCHECELAASPVFRPGQLQRSQLARLRARLDTMPVIEQAKGIIMAQSACDSAQAFDLLRRASQRSNVPVRELAAAIVSGLGRPRPVRSDDPARYRRRAGGAGLPDRQVAQL